eukprot:s2993_g9.t1
MPSAEANQVWTILDSQYYLLPQRRNRVWGLAFLITGQSTAESVEKRYKQTLMSLRSNFQFPMSKMFLKSEEEPPSNPRLKKLVEIAKTKYPYSQNVFIDASSSLEWQMMGDGVIPCLAPSHDVYSTGLRRYLQAEDVLNAQGLFRSCFNKEAYAALKEQAQEIAGNSFSSTVCQAVLMTALTCAPDAWDKLGSDKAPSTDLPPEQPHQVVARRLKRKTPAALCPAFPLQVAKEKPSRPKKPRYKRKDPKIDSRKVNKHGKSKVASIWEKEMAERLQLGEEVSFHYVVDVLKIAIEQWNHIIEQIKPQLEKPETLLPLLEASFQEGGADHDNLQQKFEETQRFLQQVLLPVVITDTDDNMMKPGFT